jgi:UDP-N-acetylmuramoyl-L-alanyl-D-glutamate--2,6-diaminopimelate ligase
MTLQQLFQYFQIHGSSDLLQTQVTGLALRSKDVIQGSVFFAIQGHTHDGHDNIQEAIERGAIAIVCTDLKKVPPEFTGPVLQLHEVRGVVSLMAARYYGFPSRDLWTVGVTGTNGKTSITYLCEWLLKNAAISAAVTGTIDHHLGAQVWSTDLTTPDPISLQKRLQEFKNHGAMALVMEVSSHALDQKRVEGVDFDVAIFSNLSRDHLDYHKTMETYHQAKQRLFTDLMWKSQKTQTFAIINTDDPQGRKMKVSERAKLVTYGKSDCDFSFEIIQSDWQGTLFQLKCASGEYEIQVPLLGLHNVYNAVAALAMVDCKKLDFNKAIESLKNFPGIPGRLQKVPVRERNIFIDYAHSPDALEKVLTLLVQNRNQLSPDSQIWTVFGCGGDRDKGKRPQMAQVAEKWSDRVIVTSDNPRTEDPEQIIADINQGFSKKNVESVVDRRAAIHRALAESAEGDVILIAGKGHENYQILGDQKINFSDYQVAQEEFKNVKTLS